MVLPDNDYTHGQANLRTQEISLLGSKGVDGQTCLTCFYVVIEMKRQETTAEERKVSGIPSNDRGLVRKIKRKIEKTELKNGEM
jgi:hypothetical protein